MLGSLLDVVLPVYLLIALGFVSGKVKEDLDTSFATFLVLYVLAPALIFSSVRSVTLSLRDFLCVGATAVCVFFCVWAISVATELYLFGRRSGAFELSASVMNAGYLGIPLIYLMFGEEGVGFAVTFMVVMAFIHFTAGISVLKGNLTKGLGSALRLPLVYAMLFSLLFKDISVPSGLEKLVKLTGDAVIPVMLFSMGVNLSRVRGSSLAWGIAGSAVRLLGGTFSALIATALLDCDYFLRAILVVQSSLPSAIFNYVLCEQLGEEKEVAISVIMTSTFVFPLYFPALKTLVGYITA
jgi:predicted permease